MVQNMVSLPDERKTSDFSVDVDTRATRRSSITEEEKKGDDDRKKSMMLTMNKNLMKSKDSRRTRLMKEIFLFTEFQLTSRRKVIRIKSC